MNKITNKNQIILSFILLVISIFSFSKLAEAKDLPTNVPKPPSSTINVNDVFVVPSLGSSSNFAYVNDSAPQSVTLTNSSSKKFGVMWSKEKIDLTKDFSYSSYVYLGKGWSSTGNADGLTITFQNDSRGTSAYGDNGYGLGVYGSSTTKIKNAFSIELDTYYNGSYEVNIPSNYNLYGHMAAVVTNDIAATSSAQNHLNPVFATSVNPLSNSKWTKLSVRWKASTQTMYWSYGNYPEQTYRITDLNHVFGGTMVYFGFTASTGSLMENHVVSINGLPFPKVSLTKKANVTSARVGDSIQYTIQATNEGGLQTEDTVFEDVLPKEMDKPINIRLIDSQGGVSNLLEGVSNANTQGEYYTWDDSQKKLTVFSTSLNPLDTTVPNGNKRTLVYDSKVLSGQDGEEKKNIVTLKASNITQYPSDSSTITIKGDPNLEVSKTVFPTIVEVGKDVNYTVVGKNTGNATLNDVVFTDVLPAGMSEPTDVTILGAVGDAYKLSKGTSNANQFGEYYEWNESSRTMTVIVSRKGQSTGIIANGTGNWSQRKITYTSKVLNGQDGDKKTNTVTFSGSNGPTKPTAKATITIKDKKIKLHIKQEVIDKNSQVVVPSRGGGNLKQVNVDAVSDVQGSYGLIFPSYEADTNKAFETISLKWSDDYQGYILDNLVPEFYDYEGYVLTTSEEKHDSNKRIKDNPPVMNYFLNNEYWLTIYITPKVSEDGPPFYNWDYKVNEFGKIKF